MVSYERVYKLRPCIKCGEMITELRGAQRYCVTCKSKCSIFECSNAVRQGGFCTTHYKPKYAVPTFTPINGRCGVEDCGRELKQKGLCALHHGRAYHYGNVGGSQAQIRCEGVEICTVEGCGKRAQGRGYCITHYARWRKYGEPGSAELLIAAQGQGSITEDGYRRVVDENGQGQGYEHRYVMEKKLGRKLRRGENVHHMDGDRLNNDPSNLELWVLQQPAGQRLEDRIVAAKKLLRENGYEVYLHTPVVENALSTVLQG